MGRLKKQGHAKGCLACKQAPTILHTWPELSMRKPVMYLFLSVETDLEWDQQLCLCSWAWSCSCCRWSRSNPDFTISNLLIHLQEFAILASWPEEQLSAFIETTSASRPSQNDTKKTISTETDVRQIMNCYLLWSPFVCLMLSWGWWSPLTHLSPPPLYIQNHTSITNLFPHHCYLSLCSLFLSVPLHERNPGEYQ